MILGRAVRGLGAERPVDALERPSCGPGCSSSAPTLAPIASPATSAASRCFGNWCAAEELAEAAALADAAASRGSRTSSSSRSATTRCGGCSRSPTSATGRSLLLLPRHRAAALRGRPGCASATCGPTARSRSWARAPRSGSCRSARPPGRRSSATSRPRGPVRRRRPALPSGAAAALDGTRRSSRSSSGSRAGPGSPAAAARTRSATRSRRSYLVNGGDVFSLQQILGHTTLDMVRRYVAWPRPISCARHRTASPADRLLRRGPARMTSVD